MSHIARRRPHSLSLVLRGEGRGEGPGRKAEQKAKGEGQKRESRGGRLDSWRARPTARPTRTSYPPRRRVPRSVVVTGAGAGVVCAILVADSWDLVPDSWGVPLLLVGFPVTLLFNLAVYRWDKERKRAAAGLCATCGYDLRATPDRCPECGAVAAAASRPA